MLTDGGIHKEAILGNPLHKHNAKFVVMIPKGTYCIFESLSEDDSAFVSYVAIPGESNGHRIIFRAAGFISKLVRIMSDVFTHLDLKSLR